MFVNMSCMVEANLESKYVIRRNQALSTFRSYLATSRTMAVGLEYMIDTATLRGLSRLMRTLYVEDDDQQVLRAIRSLLPKSTLARLLTLAMVSRGLNSACHHVGDTSGWG